MGAGLVVYVRAGPEGARVACGRGCPSADCYLVSRLPHVDTHAIVQLLHPLAHPRLPASVSLR